MRVDVLGPLRLRVDDVTVDVPGPKRRAVLALLALAENRTVAVTSLLDELWPDELPRATRASLHSHLSRLRRHLGAAAERLEGRPGGYRLDLGDGGTDLARARALLAAAAGTAPDTARRLLAEARSLWRGHPLAEFNDIPGLAQAAFTAHRLRRGIDEAYAAAALDSDAPGEAAEVAADLVAADPLSEPAVLVLARALHAVGRSADALRVAYDYRRRLATEAGLDPGPALGRIERTIAAAATTGGAAAVLPGAATGPLRGREAELAALHRLLDRERLVTLLGPGGVGKTRLAAEVAARAEPVTVLSLASVTAATAIEDALASALDLRVVRGEVLAACAALLAAGPRLLVVDNCEHLLAPAGELVASLLDRCPQLTVLATSREPLGLAAEQRLRLAPLSLDDAGGTAPSPAVAVFVDRARRLQPGFALDAAGLALVTRIVSRLDGLPLAIELAAGRLPSLGLAAVHARLDRALDLLGDGRGGTLRETIAWSYDLVPADERRLLCHLGVFPDGFDLAAAESAGARLGVGGCPAALLAHLVDASLVEVEPGPPARYRMLDSVRAFTRDRLVDDGDEEAATEGFLQWALELARWIDAAADTAEEPSVDAALRREIANLRSAWRLLRAHERRADAVAMIAALDAAAGWRDLTEVGGWSLEFADDPALTGDPGAATVLGIAAGSAWARGELDRAERLALAAIEAGPDGRWRGRVALAMVALSRGELAEGVAHGTASASLARRADQSLGIAALAAAYRGELDRAVVLNDRLAAAAQGLTLVAFHHYVAGEIAALGGDRHSAEQRYERAIATAARSGATFVEGIASVGLLTVRADAGRVTEALAGYRDLLDYWERTGGWLQQWTTLRNLARLLHTLADDETALLLDAAADRAPDAPPIAGEIHYGLPAERIAAIRATAEGIGRAQVLGVARKAIARHRAGRAPHG